MVAIAVGSLTSVTGSGWGIGSGMMKRLLGACGARPWTALTLAENPNNAGFEGYGLRRRTLLRCSLRLRLPVE